MKNFKLADIDRNALYTVSIIDSWIDDAKQQLMTGADLVSFANATAHLYDIHAEKVDAE